MEEDLFLWLGGRVTCNRIVVVMEVLNEIFCGCESWQQKSCGCGHFAAMRVRVTATKILRLRTLCCGAGAVDSNKNLRVADTVAVAGRCPDVLFPL